MRSLNSGGQDQSNTYSIREENLAEYELLQRGGDEVENSVGEIHECDIHNVIAQDSDKASVRGSEAHVITPKSPVCSCNVDVRLDQVVVYCGSTQ